MDWYLDPTDKTAGQELRTVLKDFLSRHSTANSDVDSALVGSWELISNGLRHAPGPVWVSLNWSDEQATIEVHDIGPGFDLEEGLAKEPGPDGGYGLKLAYRLGEDLRAASKKRGGARVSVKLPVWRQEDAAVPYAAAGEPAPVSISLAGEDSGEIGRENFLLAVAVTLAQNVELNEGPGAAARLINEVGASIGRQFEEAYRQAEGIERPLTVSQMADLFVRLKSAIGGEFFVLEASDNRVVLGNHRCPFGDEVQRAPSLCQMTSSVFGGIAARNQGDSRVMLDERIAVGDPGCRVVVTFDKNETPAPIPA